MDAGDPAYDAPTPARDAWRPCEGCWVRPGVHVHHRVHKALGGRHGAARVASEDPSNKILLCQQCHDASHLIASTALDGFSCRVCPVLASCYWGRRTLGETDPEGVTRRW